MLYIGRREGSLLSRIELIMAPTKGQVPESVLKKRKRDEDWATKKAAAVSDQKKKSKASRKEIFKRAEQYVKEYRDQVRGSNGRFATLES